MKIRDREPILRDTMGPNLAKRLCRTASASVEFLRSHARRPKIGTVGGPGGRLAVAVAVVEGEKRRSNKAFKRRATETESTIINQTSILFG